VRTWAAKADELGDNTRIVFAQVGDRKVQEAFDLEHLDRPSFDLACASMAGLLFGIGARRGVDQMKIEVRRALAGAKIKQHHARKHGIWRVTRNRKFPCMQVVEPDKDWDMAEFLGAMAQVTRYARLTCTGSVVGPMDEGGRRAEFGVLLQELESRTAKPKLIAINGNHAEMPA
jgi:hypothetical protein